MPFVRPGTYLQVPAFVPAPRCQEWADYVMAHKDDWIYRNNGLAYGVAWYKFIEDGLLHVYHAKAAESNRAIRTVPRFVSTIRRIGTFLRPRAPLQPRGKFWGDAGFSIIERNVMEKGDSGAPICHADYEGLAPYPEMLFRRSTRAYSATISVAQPLSGGGLRFFPKRYLANEIIDPSLLNGKDESPKDEYQRLIRGKIVKPVDLTYEVGTLTLFDSFCFHAILPVRASAKQPRIVAVTHFLYRKDPRPHWEYWY